MTVAAPTAELPALERSDFTSFFATMHDGHAPFAWQERLLNRLLSTGRWPERIAAPTGAGKTAVIDIHVFALALSADAAWTRPPRRLAMIVDRRVLVDDQYRYACELAAELDVASTDRKHALWPVAARLRALRGDRVATEAPTLQTARLRGGSPPSRSWRDDPTAPAVVCGTPDMWGSRLLFRGYGSSSGSWPREAGLLAFDSAVVVDEAHLTPQLLLTARRVAELATVADQPLGVTPVQVVETSATPRGGEAVEIATDEDDLDGDDGLRARLMTPKPVSRTTANNWATPAARAPVTALADTVVMACSAAETIPGTTSRTVGCFVNTVSRAVSVAAELRTRKLHGRPVRVIMICGQTRPIDLQLLTDGQGDAGRRVFPGLLTPRGNDEVDVIVSTQSLEVGVDLDLAAVVTDLAPASALAQRAGRVNRRGLRPEGPISILGPAEITDRTRSGPYAADELRDAQRWLERLGPDGLTPWSLRTCPPPRAADRRPLLQRPELGHAWHWARTSDDLHADPELDLWLAEDLEQDLAAGLVVRRALPQDPGEAVALLRLLRPRPHETFSVSLTRLRDVLSSTERPEAYVVRDDVDVVEFSAPSDADDRWRPRLRPGDVVVVDADLALFTDPAASPPVLVPDDGAVTTFPVPDVLEAAASLASWAPIGRVVRRWDLVTASGEPIPDMAALSELLEDATPSGARVAVRDWLSAQKPSGPLDEAVLDLLSRGRVADADVQVLRNEDGPRYVVVIDRRRVGADEDLRQVRTTSDSVVTLDDHQASVGDRAVALALAIGLDDEITSLLGLAGRHHDDGKQDSRFQVRLGGRDHLELLAKSPPGTTDSDARRRFEASALRRGWRHEQRSVVDCWAAISNSADPELVARLVGTSHGHGRSGFPNVAGELLPDPDPVAVDLFDRGRWDELIERTHRRYGVWGCAYLEALLRAADGQISREGR